MENLKKYYKLVDQYRISICPKNGIINNTAISNLNRYFNLYPNIAKENQYYELIKDNTVFEYDPNTQYISYKYSIQNDTIIETGEIQNINQVDELIPE